MRGKRRGPWPVLLPAAVAVLAARLAGARVWPPFSDEVLYVSWAHIIRDDPSQFFLSLTVSGIKPFYFWLVAAAHVFVPDPLFAGRAVSAVAAVATLIGTASLAHTVGSEEKMKDRAAGIAAVLIAVNPLLQLLTCMALIESVSIAITVWSLVLALRLAREPSVSRALVLGALIALGLLTKEYSVLSLAFLPFAWWIAGAEHAGGAGRMLALGGFAAVFLFAMVMAYPVLHDGVPIVFGTQHLAAVEGSQSVSRLASVGRNLLALERVASFQLTLPVCVLAGWALFRAVRDGRRGLGTIAALGLAMPLAVSVISRTPFTRYYVTAVPLLVAAASVLAAELWAEWRAKSFRGRHFAAACGGFLVVAPFVPLLVNPVEAPMGRIDHAQYVESWSSGFGLDELIEKLDEMAREERVDIFVAPFWGMPTAALYLALEDHPRAHIHMAPWFRDKPLLAEAKATGSLTSFPNPYDERDTRLVPYAELRRCVFVANVPQMKLGDFMRRNPDATLVEAFYRPGRKSSLAILDVPK